MGRLNPTGVYETLDDCLFVGRVLSTSYEARGNDLIADIYCTTELSQNEAQGD